MGGPQAQQPGMSGMPLQSVSVDDIIETDVVTAETDTPIPTIAAEMAEEDVGAVVIEEDDRPVGVVTDRKIAVSLEEMPELNEREAEDIMSDEIVTGSNVMTVFEVLQKMDEENIRRLPIVDEDGELEGIVTLDDILVLLGTEMQNATDIIQTQSPRL